MEVWTSIQKNDDHVFDDRKGIWFGDMDFDKPKVYSDTPSPMVLSD